MTNPAEERSQRDELAAAIESIKRSAADLAIMAQPVSPARPPWWSKVIAGLLGLTLVLLLVVVAGTTYRTFFPRPATPYYVCVYITGQGATTVTGSAPCPR